MGHLDEMTIKGLWGNGATGSNEKAGERDRREGAARRTSTTLRHCSIRSGGWCSNENGSPISTLQLLGSWCPVVLRHPGLKLNILA